MIPRKISHRKECLCARDCTNTDQSTITDTAATAVKRAAVISGQDDVYPMVVGTKHFLPFCQKNLPRFLLW